jgi:hypothetical protein
VSPGEYLVKLKIGGRVLERKLLVEAEYPAEQVERAAQTH